MPINPNLNSLAYFEAVARTGRVSLAAAELGVSAAAVSQQLKQLEEQWGVRLFRRKDRRLSLTIDGELLFQTTTSAFRMIRDARSAVLRQRNSRQLTMRSSPSFAVRWLTPRLKSFLDANPDWGVRVDATPDFSDFETEVIDLDLRYGSGAWEGLRTECIISDFVLPMCSPDYRDRLRSVSGDPVLQFAQARLIHSVKALYQWDVWLVVHNIDPPTEQAPLRFDRSSMAIQLARDGAGIVLDSATLAQEELERGSLVPLSTAFEVVEFPAYWIVCPSRHINRRPVRLFTDWIRMEGTKFDQSARALLEKLGCRLRLAKDGEPGLR
ncbi:LysR family transcriptional regulator [Sinorhizobium meliloti]|uniref:LysR substrate-binding domain-containing protein n=1 Tax=Rhizobium meliloti TaxID=382 RepID=UPI00299E26FA|nr:LysR family transcriptional regulator [Sinorhizobium meliloti]MDW9662547.1 LysR family transcriptional regulator [Sinorhizobium meliloti]MDX0052050.1 LysR family transcriptional regulator [Sinorhizobium meliloti]